MFLHQALLFGRAASSFNPQEDFQLPFPGGDGGAEEQRHAARPRQVWGRRMEGRIVGAREW